MTLNRAINDLNQVRGSDTATLLGKEQRSSEQTLTVPFFPTSFL